MILRLSQPSLAGVGAGAELGKMKDPINDQPAQPQFAGDPRNEYKEEKIQMGTAKTSMTKNLKQLENAIQEFSNLDELNSPENCMLRSATEIQEVMEAVKKSYIKMEHLNKMILVNRIARWRIWRSH